MNMHNPPHPGLVLSGLWLKPAKITVTRAAEALNVSRKTVSELINGHAAITAEMATRLELAFGTQAKTWLSMQAEFDLWQLRNERKKLGVQRLGSSLQASPA